MANEREKEPFYELKKRMEGDMENELYEDDNVFYRFLRARDLNIDMAESMLREHLKWRKTYDVKNISKFESSEVLKKYLPMNFLGCTKNGCVMRYVPTGNTDYRGLMASHPNTSDWYKHVIKCLEEDLELLRKQSIKMGKLVDKVFYIHDLKGLTLAKIADRKAISQAISMCNMYQDNYPETLQAVFVINAPAYVAVVYSILKSFLASKVLSKIKIFTDDSWKEKLLEIADAEVIPAFLGGKRTDPDGNPLCNTFIHHSGYVPVEFHKNEESFVRLPDVQKITIPRASFHEMYQDVKEPGSYLKWEFQIKSGDIKFGVLYQNGNEDKIEVVSFQNIATDDDTETGIYQCEKAGTYIIVFDNSESFLRSKDVFCKLQVMPSNTERDETFKTL